MQKNKGNQKPVEIVRKPIVPGSWHGKDARRLAYRRFLSVLATTAVYLFGSILLSIDALWGRILMAFALAGGATYYQYVLGITQGENDAAYGEILYGRKQEGVTVPESECDRSYHAAKGFFASLIGAAPFVLFALVYAFMAKPVYYSLGVLPSWTESMMSQTEFATGLVHYTIRDGFGVLDGMRILARAMIMPFVNIASYFGNQAVLLAERLSPLMVLLSPLGYAVGYLRGQHLRDMVNTGIKMGDDRKKKREIKARKKRQRQQKASRGPQQLV